MTLAGLARQWANQLRTDRYAGYFVCIKRTSTAEERDRLEAHLANHLERALEDFRPTTNQAPDGAERTT